MNDGVIIAALVSGIGALFTFTTYLAKRMLDRQDAVNAAIKEERDACLTREESVKTEATELVKAYQARDQSELEQYRKARGKASAP